MYYEEFLDLNRRWNRKSQSIFRPLEEVGRKSMSAPPDHVDPAQEDSLLWCFFREGGLICYESLDRIDTASTVHDLKERSQTSSFLKEMDPREFNTILRIIERDSRFLKECAVFLGSDQVTLEFYRATTTGGYVRIVAKAGLPVGSKDSNVFFSPSFNAGYVSAEGLFDEVSPFGHHRKEGSF